MGKPARKIGDERVHKLIRRYLEAGMMAEGLTSPRTEDTPQGRPVQSAAVNILLRELDRELERRNHAFCRYADDSNVYVWSKAAGERRAWLGFSHNGLKLGGHKAKSAVARPWERKFGLQPHVAQSPETEHCALESKTAQGQGAAVAQGGAWPQSQEYGLPKGLF